LISAICTQVLRGTHRNAASYAVLSIYMCSILGGALCLGFLYHYSMEYVSFDNLRA